MDHRRGPNPTKNSSTLILNSLAKPKCADSWMRIVRRIATTNRMIPRELDTSEPSLLVTGEQADGLPARPLVRTLQAHRRHHRRRLVRVEHRLHDLHDPGEGDAALQERGHPYLVRRVHHGGIRRPDPPHPVRHLERR